MVYGIWALWQHKMKSDTERRAGNQNSTRVPMRVRTAHGTDHAAQTRDVSANGVFLYTKSRMEKLEPTSKLVLILPPELTSGEKCWVCCQATIVRGRRAGLGIRGGGRKIRRHGPGSSPKCARV